ncbi:insulinase family protein [Shewanella sp. 3B26]|uniref:Insulinase family protein n=1 Tax=Shewanella zhuhaiensis TaxID=2919576 RepID=A0AAJ1BE47_9GAMM|nr:pitrilysin family protein [Shewanella zhuhaiensis]MCH4293109.1 insulinase family protein [Shewanella zhuhaiensis]
MNLLGRLRPLLPTSLPAMPLAMLLSVPIAAHAGECRLDDSHLRQLDQAISYSQLDNGLGLYLLPQEGKQSIAMASRFAVGSRHELAGQTGWAHLFEHSLFKGSALAPGDDYSKLMNAMGASFNASTSFDDTRYYSRIPAEGLNFSLALERDRFSRPELSEQAVANQQKTVLAEMAQTIDNQPYFRAAMEYLLAQAADTPYRHAIIGTKADIQAATPEHLQAFHRRHYQPAAMTLALTGKLPDNTRALVQQHFGDWNNQAQSDARNNANASPQISNNATATEPPLWRPRPASHGEVVDERAPWPGLLLAWHTVGRSHPDAAAIRLLELQLFQRIASGLERAGIKGGQTMLSQSLPLDMDLHGMTNLVLVPRARVSLDTLAKGVGQLLQAAADKPLSESELCGLKSLWLSQYQQRLERDELLAQQLAATPAADNPSPLQAPWRAIESVTAADLQRVAVQYFNGHTVRLDLLPAWHTRFGKGLLEWLPDGWADGLEELAL